MTDDILETIDNAIDEWTITRDWTVSSDAMRCMPEPPPEPDTPRVTREGRPFEWSAWGEGALTPRELSWLAPDGAQQRLPNNLPGLTLAPPQLAIDFGWTTPIRADQVTAFVESHFGTLPTWQRDMLRAEHVHSAWDRVRAICADISKALQESSKTVMGWVQAASAAPRPIRSHPQPLPINGAAYRRRTRARQGRS